MKSVTYFSLIDRKNSPGVANKLENTVQALNNIGYSADSDFTDLSILGGLKMLLKVARTRSDIIFIRYSIIFSPLLFFVLIYLRAKGRKIIVDIPTPRYVVAKEILEEKSFLSYFKLFVLYFSSSWVLLPASRVVQYASESIWFELGLKSKTLKLGNGVIVKRLPLSQGAWDGKSNLNLIAVAMVSNWHGYDRLLKAMSIIKQTSNISLKLKIVGDGPSIPALKKLSAELGLDNVEFTGMLSGEKLDEAYNNTHIGVSSLGLYRIGIKEASPLKAREYAARGLITLGAAEDVDFSDDSEFRIKVPNDDSVDSIAQSIIYIDAKALKSKESVRSYAIENLSMEAKVKAILEGIVCR